MKFFRNLLERREFSLQRWETFLDGLGQASSSGVQVSDATALTWAIVWGCVTVLMQDMAKIPLPVYRRLGRDGSGGREEAADYYLWPVLRHQANPFMTAAVFKGTMQGHLATGGNAYAYIQRKPTGEVEALWPRHPSSITPRVKNGEVVYEYNSDGQRWVYGADEIFHLRGMSRDGVVGMSPVEIFRDGIGLGLGYQQHASHTFRNSARPSLIGSFPNAQIGKEKADEIAQALTKQNAGIPNAGKILVTYGGLDLKPWGFSNKDAEFIESRRLSNEDACRIWRMPPHKVMDYTKSAYANMAVSDEAYVNDTLRFWQVTWEEEVMAKLIRPDERSTYYSEHDNSALLKGTPKERAEVEEIYVRSGISNINEVRRSHNWRPVEGGDINRVQAQMIDITAPAPAHEQPTT